MWRYYPMNELDLEKSISWVTISISYISSDQLVFLQLIFVYWLWLSIIWLYNLWSNESGPTGFTIWRSLRFGPLDPQRLITELSGTKDALEKRLQSLGNDELQEELGNFLLELLVRRGFRSFKRYKSVKDVSLRQWCKFCLSLVGVIGSTKN